MSSPGSRNARLPRPLVILAVWAVLGGLPPFSARSGELPESSAQKPLIRKGDRVAWVGSSSTKIGVWPRTVEFLLRTRHPSVGLEFKSFTTGGGTFATGLEHLDEWLGDFQPTVVFFNYGGNDAAAGSGGSSRFKENIERCVAKVRAKGARVVLITPQAADVRKSKAGPAANRTLYAETMLDFGRRQGWAVIDIHHPLEAMQRANQRDDPAYTILKDTIHLTDAAYVGWGFFLYDRLELPFVRSAAVLTAAGLMTAAENCALEDVKPLQDGLSFTRLDRVLPILPPGPLPPRLSVPLEAHSRYLLTVTALAPGKYEVRCEGRPIGTTDAEALAVGVNLNSLLLDEGREAPWATLAGDIWKGKSLDRVGQTAWRFEIHKR